MAKAQSTKTPYLIELNNVSLKFNLPNEKIDNPDKKNGGYDYLFDYATTVDDVEAQTGLDFFTNLPKDERKRYESTLDIKAWKKFMKK